MLLHKEDMPLTTPHNFQNSNKWFNSIGRPNRYSDFVTSTLKPYVNTRTTPPNDFNAFPSV